MVDASVSDIAHPANQSNLSTALGNVNVTLVHSSNSAESSPDESSSLPYTPVESISSCSSQEDLLENKFSLPSNDIGHQIDMLFDSSNQVIAQPNEVTEQALEKLLNEIENRSVLPVENYDLEPVIVEANTVQSNGFNATPFNSISLTHTSRTKSYPHPQPQQTNQHKQDHSQLLHYTPQPRGFLNSGPRKRQKVISSSQLQLPGGQPTGPQQPQFSGIPTSGLKQVQQQFKHTLDIPEANSEQVSITKQNVQSRPQASQQKSQPPQPPQQHHQQGHSVSVQQVQTPPQENKFLKCFSILKSNYLSLCAAHNSLIVRYNNSEVERTKLKVQNEELKGLLDGALHELNCYRNNERKRLHHQQ